LDGGYSLILAILAVDRHSGKQKKAGQKEPFLPGCVFFLAGAALFVYDFKF
jgi:hypothetical protein